MTPEELSMSTVRLTCCHCRLLPGYTIVLLWACGCEYMATWLMWETTSNNASRYSTLDNVDGKQARRTGTSSGLGELFE